VPMKVLIAIPVFNERQYVAGVLAKVRRYQCDLLVIDDGSTDGTSGVASEWSAILPLELVLHESNMGLGTTIRDGLCKAGELAVPGDVIVTMDADNTHSPSLIPSMVGMIEQGYDLVIASRYRPGSKVIGLTPIRRLMTHCAKLLYQARFPTPGVRDYTCGFRAYSARTLHRAFAAYGEKLVTERNFVCMAEILLKLRRMGVRIAEVPLVLRYDRKAGLSKMSVGRTAKESLKLILRSLEYGKTRKR